MIQPLADFILVKVVKVTELRGIEIPQVSQDEEELVEVVALGSDIKPPYYLQVGDRVLAKPGSGIRVPLGGEMQVFIRESDIMGVVKGGNDGLVCK